jgi:hypothetical protein
MSLKSIIGLVVVIVLCLAGYYWWEQTHADATMDSGSVTSSDTPSSGKLKMDSGAVDLDGRDSSSPNYAASGSTGNRAAAAAAPATVAPASSVPLTPVTGQAPSSPLPSGTPAGDTLSADPPQGMAFGGSGKFQWYRQGNLTWRINTESGSSCVAFATMDEWAKPIVASHGCGNG